MQILHLASLLFLPYIPPPAPILKILGNEYIFPPFLFPPSLPTSANYYSPEKQKKGRKDNTGKNIPQPPLPLFPKPQFLPRYYFVNCELLKKPPLDDRKLRTKIRLKKLIAYKDALQPNKITLERHIAPAQVNPKASTKLRNYLLLTSLFSLWTTIAVLQNILNNSSQLTNMERCWLSIKTKMEADNT